MRGAHDAHSPLVRDVLRYVEEHFAEPISLRHVAAALGYAPSHLTHTFRRRVGVPVQAWIIKRRIQAAEELLITTNANVATVCEAVGFNDLCYFSRQFARHVGNPPGRYRKVQNDGGVAARGGVVAHTVAEGRVLRDPRLTCGESFSRGYERMYGS